VRVLFAHQNAPAQFQHLAAALADRGHDVIVAGQRKRNDVRGARFMQYAPQRKSPTHHYLRDATVHAENGMAVHALLRTLANDNWMPDMVIGHNGWGEMLFVKDVIPRVSTIGYFEFFYRPSGQDTGFDPAFPASLEDCSRLRMRNLTNLVGLDAVDGRWTPTQWQRSVYPKEWQDRIEVIHEGIDTSYMTPGEEGDTSLTLPNGEQIAKGAPLITFVARNLEPYRGFHVFMRALPRILERLPDARVIIVGGESVSYGRQPANATSWKEALLGEVDIDKTRVFFAGRVTYAQLRTLFRVSAAHVYLTYPFVLSWSMLEAMACGAVVVASATSPVTEVIRDGENGLLFDFFDEAGLVRQVQYAVEQRGALASLRHAARQHIVEHYELNQVCLPAQLKFLEQVSGQKM